MATVHVERDGQLLPVEIDPNHLSIDPSALDIELCQVGRMMYEYGVIEAEVKLRVARLENYKDDIMSRTDSEIRTKYVNAGIKFTEAKVESEVLQSTDYKECAEQLAFATSEAITMKWVMSALVHKSENLRALAYREGQSIKADRG
jgi:hypothetical protein